MKESRGQPFLSVFSEVQAYQSCKGRLDSMSSL